MIATKIENAASRKCNFVTPLISSKKNGLEDVPSLSCQHMWIQLDEYTLRKTSMIVLKHYLERWIG